MCVTVLGGGFSNGGGGAAVVVVEWNETYSFRGNTVTECG